MYEFVIGLLLIEYFRIYLCSNWS